MVPRVPVTHEGDTRSVGRRTARDTVSGFRPVWLPGTAGFRRRCTVTRIATRYEKRADNYLAMLTLAAILLWL
jgi:hypothetical protein